MPSIGHVAVGLAAARLSPLSSRRRAWPWALGLAAASLLPDLDCVAFALGIPYHAPFGHRGATHSLAFAVACGLLAAVVARSSGLAARAGWTVGLVIATHGLLDTLTNGGLGSALLWPFSNERFFAPWRPIPVAPIGAALLGPRGLRVMLVELVAFAPLLVVAVWPRRPAA
jgi:inner membrane protein